MFIVLVKKNLNLKYIKRFNKIIIYFQKKLIIIYKFYLLIWKKINIFM